MDSWHRGHTCVYGEAHRQTVLLQSHTQATLFSKKHLLLHFDNNSFACDFFFFFILPGGGLYLKAANASRRGAERTKSMEAWQ